MRAEREQRRYGGGRIASRIRRCDLAPFTVEGVVENGQIRLHGNVTLPEHAKVYVVVPGVDDSRNAPRSHVRSPRLARPEHAADFVKQVVEGSANEPL